jgi:hypothetical protein
MRAFLRKRWVIVSLGLVLVAVVGWNVDAYLAERMWKQYMTAERARGAKIYLSEMPPLPTVPDELNFAAVPFWKSTPKNGEELDVIIPPRLSVVGGRIMPSKIEGFSRRNLAVYRAEMIKQKWLLPEDTNSSDAEALLRGLEKKVGEHFRTLHVAAGRPKIRFPDSPANKTAVFDPHAEFATRLAHHLELKIYAHIALGQRVEALTAWKDGWALARSVTSPTNLIRALRSDGMETSLLASLWEGHVVGLWNDDALIEMERLLEEVNPFQRYADALEHSRAEYNTEMEPMLQQRHIHGMTRSRLEDQRPTFWEWFNSRRHRWWRDLQMDLNDSFSEHRQCFHPAEQRWDRIAAEAIESRYAPAPAVLPSPVPGMEPPPRQSLRQTFRPSFLQFGRKACYHAAQLRMARLSCALERYRRTHGRYPGKLEDLVPAFLPSVPLDPGDGKPMRYQPLPEGGYLLYSIGADGRDEGGSSGQEMREPHSSCPDWRWWSPPAAPATAK